MLLKDTSRTKNNQELVKASIDALVKALEAGHSEALSAYLTTVSQFHIYWGLCRLMCKQKTGAFEMPAGMPRSSFGLLLTWCASREPSLLGFFTSLCPSRPLRLCHLPP